MASAQSSTSSVVPELMATVMQLSPGELREFEQRFTAWQRHDGEQDDDETALIETCQARLSPADERRLKRLIANSEQGAQQAKKLEEYRILIQRTEKLDATRLTALAQLARRWGKPVRAVMEIVGWETGDEGATRDSAVPAKTRPRSRR